MKKIALSLSPNDKQLILSYLKGGLLLGAGTGAAVSLANELGDSAAEATGKDDAMKKDVLVMNLRRSIPPKIASFLRSPAALIGGAGAAVGGYALIRALHQWYKKKQLESELKDAENVNLDLLTAPKTASVEPGKPMSVLEMGSAIPLTTAALTALAAGIITHNSLKKNYPDRQSAVRMQPRRVIVRRDDNADGISEDEQSLSLLNKNASALLYEITSLLRPPDQETDFDNLIKSAAAGQLPAMRRNVLDFDMETLLVTVGGNSFREFDSSLPIKMAARVIAEDPLLRPSADILAAIEFQQRAPWFCKIAAGLDEDDAHRVLSYGVYQADKAFADELASMLVWSAGGEDCKSASAPELLLSAVLDGRNEPAIAA